MSESTREEDVTEQADTATGELAETEGIVEQPPGPSAGELLREARDASGISVADVARQLKLGVRQIEALEADDHAHLPGPTFVRGFIRNYAKLLQVAPEPILDAYRRAAPEAPEQVIVAQEDQVSFSEYEKPPYLKYGAALAVALVVVGVAFYLWFPTGTQAPEIPKEAAATVTVPLAPPSTESLAPPAPAPSPAAPEPAPVQAAPLPPAPAAPATTPVAATPAHGASVTLEFGGDSWVEAKDKDGKIVFSQLNRANSKQTFQGVVPMELVIGNADKVKLTYKGQLIDLTPFTRGDSAVARIKLD